MPYIKPMDRDADTRAHPYTAGELNYAITMLCKEYIDLHGLNYSRINSVMGALEGAKLEFYRRVAAPYEDLKIAENGDVY